MVTVSGMFNDTVLLRVARSEEFTTVVYSDTRIARFAGILVYILN